jgi:WD40 repeat protein
MTSSIISESFAGFSCLSNVCCNKVAFSSKEAHDVSVLTLSDGAVVQLRGHTRALTCLELFYEGSKALSGSFDNHVKIWDCLIGELLFDLALSQLLFRISMNANNACFVYIGAQGLICRSTADCSILKTKGISVRCGWLTYSRDNVILM